MSLDERGRRAAEAVGGRLDGATASMADLDARHRAVQRRRMRVGLAAFVVLVLVAVPALLVGGSADEDGRAAPGGSPPLGTLTSGAWSSVPVHTSGFGDGSLVWAMASTPDGIVAVGSRPVDGTDVRTAWFSDDGFTWVVADAPEAPGLVTAVGSGGDLLLAVGTSTSTGGPADVVWGSRDGGRRWEVVAEGPDVFGPPAPSGRPFVTSLHRVDGRWLAVGGAADGTGETWVSDDGRSWTATFPEDRTGGPEVVDRGDGSLLAYWVDPVWTSEDGVIWTARDPSRPAGIDLRAVADGAAVGIGYQRNSPYTAPTPLLRSGDGGLTWTEDPSFLAAATDATAYVVETVDGVIVAGGSEEGAARPAAWVSAGDGRWVGMPSKLSDGQEGGGIRLLARVGSSVVLLAGGPVAVSPGDAPPPAPSRFFVLDTAQLPAAPLAPGG